MKKNLVKIGEEFGTPIYAKVKLYGLFEWNKENKYPAERAIKTSKKELKHDYLVCRPIELEKI